MKFRNLLIILGVMLLLGAGCAPETAPVSSVNSKELFTCPAVDAISTGNLTLVQAIPSDADSDGQDENIEMYTAAQKDADGNFMWDDGQQWKLLVRDGEKDYLLFDEYVQLGQLDFWLYAVGEEDILHIGTFQTDVASFTVADYVYDREQDCFIKTITLNQGDIKWVNSIYKKQYF